MPIGGYARQYPRSIWFDPLLGRKKFNAIDRMVALIDLEGRADRGCWQ